MYAAKKDLGLEIIAVPCNQFGGQEPGSDDEIVQFTKQYGVTFPIAAKTEVNGDNAHPVY